MRIVVIGTGGVGGYFGARLTEAGENVTFVARGAHLEAIKSRGLTVYSALGDMHLRDVQCTENTRDIGHADIVMIAVKLWATDEAIQTAKPLLGKNTGIISFQNGILAEESLIAAYSSQHAMGGVANIAALIEEPGVIRHNGNMASLAFGELNNTQSERAQSLLTACSRANIKAEIPDDINRAIWEKYIRLVTMSAMTTLCRMPIGPIRDEVHTRNLLSQILAEIIDVGKAKGLKFSDNVLQEQLDIIDGYPPSMVASMCGDLRRGYPLEVPWFSGTIVRLGKELNIPTPANGFVYAALKLFEHGRPIEAQI
ncbi:MAG: 2-dehydropantoate 2-reductase [Burkholderiales bacterium]|jgi:2-dehydropantoate 2-reductase|nr:2-dehydropantoate 2-reductase [Burkholderiales bacterium]